MAILREGQYGKYYGSLISESEPLPTIQMETNATYIFNYLSSKGWTKNAISGLLGNMESESTINPGRWQSDNVLNLKGGYGLVQWTPATNYLDWCNEKGISNPSEMDNNLSRIIFELENGLQWIATDEYNLTFEEFSKSVKSVEWLASAFLKCYERAGVEVEETRRANALKWNNFLKDKVGGNVNPAQKPKKKKKGFNFILFNKQRRII